MVVLEVHGGSCGDAEVEHLVDDVPDLHSALVLLPFERGVCGGLTPTFRGPRPVQVLRLAHHLPLADHTDPRLGLLCLLEGCEAEVALAPGLAHLVAAELD
eukprot:3961153-Lingulodinium_polyedra.AAC.2